MHLRKYFFAASLINTKNIHNFTKKSSFFFAPYCIWCTLQKIYVAKFCVIKYRRTFAVPEFFLDTNFVSIFLLLKICFREPTCTNVFLKVLMFYTNYLLSIVQGD